MLLNLFTASGLRPRCRSDRSLWSTQQSHHRLRRQVYARYFEKALRRNPISNGLRSKAKLTKRDFAFSGVFTCRHCGCANTAEQKKKPSGRTYVYDHCTNGKGICSNVTYLREEKVIEAVGEALSRIQINPDVIEWTKHALLTSSKDEREYRETAVALTAQYMRLGKFIAGAYQNKLEGNIEPDFWLEKTTDWKREQSEIEIQLQAYRQANTNYILDGVKLMELAAKASELFKVMTIDEKRKMLGLVLSNPRIENVSVRYD